MPLVSIVTPAYRAERFLEESLASVQGQSFSDWECLVVDDASPDRAAALAERIAAGGPRIRLLRHATNRGAAAARNTALEVASGRDIAFLDADDLWLPAKLERQLALMQANEATISYTAYRRIDDSGTRVGRVIRVPAEMTWRRLLANTAIATLTAMVALEQYQREELDSLFSVAEVGDFFTWGIDENGQPRSVNYDWRHRRPRQLIEKRYLENGSIYLFSPTVLRREKNRMGGRLGVFVMPRHKLFQIDNLEDMKLAETIMHGYGLDRIGDPESKR